MPLGTPLVQLTRLGEHLRRRTEPQFAGCVWNLEGLVGLLERNVAGAGA